MTSCRRQENSIYYSNVISAVLEGWKLGGPATTQRDQFT